MELRTLSYFLTTAREGNITRAADILHMTQPTLSRQLMELERELGTTLLVRGKRALTLTDDGLLLRQRAEELLALADKTEQEFAGRRDTISGVVTLGASEAKGSLLLAKYMKAFSQQYPLVKFDIYNMMADNIREHIAKGLVDIGLVLEPVDTSKYDFLRLPGKETWGVLFHQDDPLSQKDHVSAQEIRDRALFLPKRPNARSEVLNWMDCDESQLNILVSYDLLSNVALLVEEGMGCAVCLDGALSIRHSPKLRFVPLWPEHTTRSVLIWKKNHLFNPASSLFLQMINRMRANTADTM